MITNDNYNNNYNNINTIILMIVALIYIPRFINPPAESKTYFHDHEQHDIREIKQRWQTSGRPEG